MKNLQFILILIMAILTFSAQFEIMKDVTELQNDLTAQKYGYKDVNGQWCAVLKVHTDIKDLQFEGFGYEKHDYWAESGIYIVYLQPESKSVRFIKNEFIAKNYTFPFKLKSNSVYQIDIKGVGEEKKIENIIITIQTVPSGGEIFFDGKNVGFVEQIETGVGPHELTVKRSGYEDKTTNIQVSAKNNYFRIDLVPLPGTIQLNKIKPEVDYTKSGMSVSLETGLYNDNDVVCDTLVIKVPSSLGFGFGLNSNIKINEWLDALIKVKLFTLQGKADDSTSTEDAIYDGSTYGSLSGGIKLKFPKRVYLFCEAGVSSVSVDYIYSGRTDYFLDSWSFSYYYGLGYEYKRLDFLLKVSSYVTDYDTIIMPGLSLGYKFWIFKVINLMRE